MSKQSVELAKELFDLVRAGVEFLDAIDRIAEKYRLTSNAERRLVDAYDTADRDETV